MYLQRIHKETSINILSHIRKATSQRSALTSLISCRCASKMSSSEEQGNKPLSMPLNRIRILASELLKKRVENKTGKRGLVRNTASLQIIGTNSQGSTPSILVNSEGRSYMFNCGEGTQRFCYANKIKLLSLENIFITNHSWSRVAGTVGLSLTLQDIGAPEINIKSADGIGGLFDSTNQFVLFNTGIKCGTSTYHESRYEDESIIIEAFPIEPETRNTSSESNLSSKRLKSTSKLIAYSCKLPDLPGSLDAKKCRELKVPIGKELALLKSGKDVVLKDGTVVKSVDVCGEKQKGLQFVVLECPSQEYISKFKTNAALNSLRSMRQTTDQEQQIDLVIHLSPLEVTSNVDYVSWMNGFSESCKHLLLFGDETAKRPYMLDCFRMHYLLRKLDDQIFPSLIQLGHFENIVGDVVIDEGLQNDKNDISGKSFTEQEENCFIAKDYDLDFGKALELDNLDKITLRPRKSVEVMDDKLDIDYVYRIAKQADPNFEQLYSNLKKSQKNLPTPKNYEPELVFLGTGSAQPSKYRNTSGILINFTHPKPFSVILDCGEDTYGQLLRYYGFREAGRVLAQMEFIYVSHHHADHHIGLIRLLLERKKLTKKPVILLLPPGIERLLDYHNKNFEDLSETYEIFSTTLLEAQNMPSSPDSSSQESKSSLLQKLDHLLEDVKTIRVSHCSNSFAVLFRFKIDHLEMRNFSIAYSGDARPSETFVSVAKGCDLLIHEATFDFRSVSDAISKKHCTSTEAIQVGKEMQAKFTILTHFSQRLSKIPYFTEEFNEDVGFAFDNLTVKCPSQLRRLPLLKPVLTSIYRDFLGELDVKYEKAISKQLTINELLKSSVT